MAGPLSIPKRDVPRRILHGMKLPDTVARTEKYVTDRANFDQTYLSDIQRGLSDNNGQAVGGIVNASDLVHRSHPYQMQAAIFPHVGDLPSQPAATTYDGPLVFGPLPAGVNNTYGYARWAGWLNIQAAGTYQFTVSANNGANLFVNKVQLIGSLTSAGPIIVTSPLALVPGMVPIVVEWQWVAAPSLSVQWTLPGSAVGTPIPASALSRSLNQITQFLVGFWFNGSAAFWYP